MPTAGGVTSGYRKAVRGALAGLRLLHGRSDGADRPFRTGSALSSLPRFSSESQARAGSFRPGVARTSRTRTATPAVLAPILSETLLRERTSADLARRPGRLQAKELVGGGGHGDLEVSPSFFSRRLGSLEDKHQIIWLTGV